MEFSENLKRIRKSKKLSQKEFGELINKTLLTVSRYENGKITPPLRVIKEIAEKLDISFNELAGINDTKKDIPLINQIIKDKRKELRLTQSDFAKLINKSKVTVARYDTGDIIPENTLIICCEVLGISKNEIGLKGTSIKNVLESKNFNYYLVYFKEQELIYKKIIRSFQKLDLKKMRDILKGKEILKVEIIDIEEM